MAIIPARVRKPREKATVESGVDWLETWLLEWLSDRIYYSFEALNADIRDRVAELSKRDFKHRPGPRESNFLALDKLALRPLPKDSFEYYEAVPVKSVSNNYHVLCDGFYYSVPYSLYKRPVMIYVYSKKIEIFNAEGTRVAVHTRRYSGRRYVTDESHMPANHSAVREFNKYDGAHYRYRASGIGQNAYRFVDTLLKSAAFEEQAYKSCMAVVNFSKTYGNTRVDNACKRAIELNSVNYTTLKNILKNNQDKKTVNVVQSDADTPTPEHENLRVREWE